MINSLSTTSKEIMRRLLGSDYDDEREQALVELAALPDAEKEDAEAYLVERLELREDARNRGWCVSGLAALRAEQTEEQVLICLDRGQKEDEWVRYWSLIALDAIKSSKREDYLTQATQDSSAKLRALAFRLLLENGIDVEQNTDEVVKMARMPRGSEDRLCVFRALQARSGHGDLPHFTEEMFLPILEESLLDYREPEATKIQAARMLGDLKWKQPEAIRVLSQSLQMNLRDAARRACVDALGRINKPQTKEALVYALCDRDAEVRVRAASALKVTLGTPEAVRFIVVDHLLQQDRPSSEYVAALRQIDDRAATQLLSVYLQHVDPKIVRRAMHAMVLLGNQEAVRALREHQAKTLEANAKLMGEMDKRLADSITEILNRTNTATGHSIRLQGVLAGVMILVLVGGVAFAVWGTATPNQTSARDTGLVMMIIGAVCLMLVVFFRRPIDSIRGSAASLVQMYTVFLGHLRQMRQIDAAFERMYLSHDFSVKKVIDSIRQIQDSVEQTLSDIKEHLESD